jgi:hypothetical protein
MRGLLGAWVMLAGAWAVAVPVAQGSDCTAPTKGARIESEGPGRSLVRVEWPDGTAKVRLQLAADPEFGKPLIDRKVPCCEARVRNLEVGQYHWRILDAEADAEQCRSSFEIVGRPQQE